MKVDRVVASIVSGSTILQFDSRSPRSSDPRVQALKDDYSAAIGREYRLRVDARGRVVEATIPDAVTEALHGSPFLAIADGGSLLSEKGLKNLFAQVFPSLPDRQVAQGDAWDRALELPTAPVRLSMAYHETLAELGLASARIESTIKASLRPEPATALAVEVVRQSGQARCRFDTKAGRVAASTLHQEFDIKVVHKGEETGQSVVLDERTELLTGPGETR